jgi:tRNA modification GTPase
MQLHDTICALSTPQGMGAIAVIRLSGDDVFTLLEKAFVPFSKRHRLTSATAYQNLFGKIVDGKQVVDEVMVAVYKNPQSYTGQDLAEINCHGSVYIQEQIIKLMLKLGARMADPGEFTLRAFFNGKMDLSQAEAVADLIASENKAAHTLAMQQMRGGFSAEIKALREELINFASLIELELDFAEEDVEFANRGDLDNLLNRVKQVLTKLLESFDTGNVLKNGLPVAIVGAPNAGKSTLLNALLNEEKAIVTEIAGTTRDAIEDELNLGGVKFRFIDTAGIRETQDLVESMGIKKTYAKIAESKVILYLFNATFLADNATLIEEEIAHLKAKADGKTLLILANKTDLLQNQDLFKNWAQPNVIAISALQKTGLENLKTRLLEEVNLGALHREETIVSNARHAHALQESLHDIIRVEEGLANGLSGDFLAMDIREAFKHLGSIIGEVDTDRDILGNIFGKFCIGK